MNKLQENMKRFGTKNLKESNNILNESPARLGAQLKRAGFQINSLPNIKDPVMAAHIGDKTKFLSIFVRPGGYYYGILMSGGTADTVNGMLDPNSEELDSNFKRMVDSEFPNLVTTT